MKLSRVAAAITTVGCPAMLQTEVTVVIGGQTMQLLLDTGSSTLVVASTLCTGCTVLASKGALWNISRGITSGVKVRGSYGDGTNGWNGTAYTANVSLGGASVAGLRFAALSSEQGHAPLTTSETNGDECTLGSAVGTGNQGILGLGPPGLAIADTDDWLTLYFQQNDVPRTFSLTQCASGGTLSLGVTDAPALYVATPPSRARDFYSQFYNIPLEGVGLAGAAAYVVNGDTFLDSGTNVNLLPSDIVAAVWNVVDQHLHSSGVFSSSSFDYYDYAPNGGFSCATTASTAADLNALFPAMQFVLPGGKQLTVPAVGSYLSVMGVADGQQTVCKTLFPSQSGPFILGWPFQSAFVTFVNATDGDGACAVGFTPLNTSACNSSVVGNAGGGGTISTYTGGQLLLAPPPSAAAEPPVASVPVASIVAGVVGASALLVCLVAYFSFFLWAPARPRQRAGTASRG